MFDLDYQNQQHDLQLDQDYKRSARSGLTDPASKLMYGLTVHVHCYFFIWIIRYLYLDLTCSYDISLQTDFQALIYPFCSLTGWSHLQRRFQGTYRLDGAVPQLRCFTLIYLYQLKYHHPYLFRYFST